MRNHSADGYMQCARCGVDPVVNSATFCDPQRPFDRGTVRYQVACPICGVTTPKDIDIWNEAQCEVERVVLAELLASAPPPPRAKSKRL